MARLTKQQAALHAQACAYLEKDILTFDERLFVLEHWQESANHINGVAGAFFTPQSLASDFSIEVEGRRIIDLCAGIGSLAFAYYHRDAFRRGQPALEIVCVRIPLTWPWGRRGLCGVCRSYATLPLSRLLQATTAA